MDQVQNVAPFHDQLKVVARCRNCILMMEKIMVDDILITKLDIIQGSESKPPLINIRPQYFDEAIRKKDLPQPVTRVSGRIRMWRKSDIEHFIKTGEVRLHK